jgi:hypothetical protein
MGESKPQNEVSRMIQRESVYTMIAFGSSELYHFGFDISSFIVDNIIPDFSHPSPLYQKVIQRSVCRIFENWSYCKIFIIIFIYFLLFFFKTLLLQLVFLPILSFFIYLTEKEIWLCKK